ncbi:glycosyl hydrolase [Bacteroides ihuae]|uniref:glycosyl hydrolase n=1 Tax=Bacteroides ihuae TaxID=1852362 RepID=UPI0008D92D6A
MNNTKSRILLLVICLSVFGNLMSQETLRESFRNPSEEAKPWTFWYWMYGAVSKEGIKADLEAMKEVGLGGAYLMPIREPSRWPNYEGAVKQLTPQWWEMVRYSMQEADRLGLKLGMHICDGFALAGGPWITPKESMQKVVWSDTIVSGGMIKKLVLARPEAYEGYYEDIALLALPVSEEGDQPLLKGGLQKNSADLSVNEVSISPLYKITCGNTDTGKSIDPSKGVTIAEDGVIRSSLPCWIQYEYAQPFTCRNIEIVLNGNNYQAHRLKVTVSDDGVNFREVKQLVPARQGWQNTDENSTHSIPATTARYFRFYWTPVGSEPGSEDMDAAKWKPNLKIKQLILHSEPRLNQWEGKAGLVWRVAPRTSSSEIGAQDCIRKEQIIHLTAFMKNGVLTAKLPAGRWRLLRMGHTSTGHTNATGGTGMGLECDKFSETAVKKQFDNWFGAAFAQTDSVLARKVLKYMHVDSWECGSQNWSDNFPAEFLKRRGYDLMPYLPLLAGIPMDNVAKSEEVLHDVRTTIAELVVDVFYKTLAMCAKSYDCESSAECVAPTMVSDGLLHYKMVDRPMGEFWLNSPTHDKPNDMLDAISGAHIYGKNIVQAEGFTELRGTWNETPAMLKTLLDRNYALGINKLFFHVNVHNPYTDRKPGMTLDGIGLFFQRDQTWWKDGAKALVDYASRCQALLQYGHPVADIAVFIGEEIPSRAVLPERLVPSLPGIFGTERVKSEQVRLANVGQPLREQPVGVSHSANMADPDKWVNPLRGYAYDSFNRDALLRLAKAENGRMILPGGASYKALILPLPHPMSPDSIPFSAEVQAKLDELRKAGVLIPQLPYKDDDFSAYGLQRDAIVPEEVAWTHRRGEAADLYFISNQQDKERTFTVSLRIAGKKPELWNPVTGEIDKEIAWKEVDGRTEVLLTLAAGESVFVVFHNHITTSESDLAKNVSTASTDKNKKKTISEPMALGNRAWTVSFPLINKVLIKDTLFDWSQSEDEQVKYYSGTVTYKTSFKWSKKPKGRIFLSLGKVADVATIRMNGISCGIVWTAPYEVDVTDALKKGVNILQIEVTNTWANAIKGADSGKAPFEGIWTNAKYRMKEDVLIPAGLFGPVQLLQQK